MREVQLRVPSVCKPKGARDREKRDKHELNESIEEYLEGIWRLQREGHTVGTGEIAQYMTVKPASVTPMLKQMADMGLVEHVPYHGVQCTEKGEAVAVQLIRKHRLLERLLVDFLELPWDGVHELACKLEHYISMDVADRIAHAMGYPTTCPHGNPVDATIEDGSKRMGDSNVGDHLVIIKISDERDEFLAYLQNIGVIPGAEVEVLERSPFGDVFTLSVDGREKTVAVGKEVTSSVFVLKKE